MNEKEKGLAFRSGGICLQSQHPGGRNRQTYEFQARQGYTVKPMQKKDRLADRQEDLMEFDLLFRIFQGLVTPNFFLIVLLERCLCTLCLQPLYFPSLQFILFQKITDGGEFEFKMNHTFSLTSDFDVIQIVF